jgi:hypothetical protein
MRGRRLSADPELLWLLGGGALAVTGIVLATAFGEPWDSAVSGVLAGAFLVVTFFLMRRMDRRQKRERRAAAEPGAASDPHPSPRDQAPESPQAGAA